MRRTKLALWSLLLILGYSSSAYGQREPPDIRAMGKDDAAHIEKMIRHTMPDIPKRHLEDSVLIINDNSSKVSFNLRNKSDEKWVAFSLEGNQESTYKNADEIKIITTGKGEVHYIIEDNQRYKIFWNDDRELWDVYKLKPK